MNTVEDAAFAHHGVVDVAVVDLRRRKISAARIDWGIGIEEIKFRKRRREVEVRLVKRADRPDVFPISIKDMRLDVVLVDGGGNYLTAEIDSGLVRLEQLDQLFVIEYVDPH